MDRWWTDRWREERERGREKEDERERKRKKSSTLKKIKNGKWRERVHGGDTCIILDRVVAGEGRMSSRVGASRGHVQKPQVGTFEWVVRRVRGSSREREGDCERWLKYGPDI